RFSEGRAQRRHRAWSRDRPRAGARPWRADRACRQGGWSHFPRSHPRRGGRYREGAPARLNGALLLLGGFGRFARRLAVLSRRLLVAIAFLGDRGGPARIPSDDGAIPLFLPHAGHAFVVCGKIAFGLAVIGEPNRERLAVAVGCLPLADEPACGKREGGRHGDGKGKCGQGWVNAAHDCFLQLRITACPIISLYGP